jgi:hypothetical protein
LAGLHVHRDCHVQCYLTYVLERIGEHPVNRIDDLLPWAVAPQLETA